ncbi:hypothetical protein OEA41_003368 [Lepraria neglecta]|uniref:F-box domain-containing protein n=1 Tax=Lepraria neglecta TaxID=209136 RepID=A0AAD9Z457_9LECA|nr:hypothetical protein OEA41_003368 [Lepraria neglecta]
MTRCKEFIQGEDTTSLVDIRRCLRSATKGFPYCWQHCEHAREVAEALNTSDDGLNTAMLQHLTCQGKEYRSRTRQISTIPASNALSILEQIQNKPGPSLGDLDQPFEILRMIISELSFSDLRSFKATNSRAREIVIFNPEYRNIVNYAPETVATLYKTDLQAAFSIDRIHDVLVQSRCTICDRRGGYVFFPSFQRCCERCARYDDEFVPVSLDEATRDLGITGKGETNSLPKMRYLPENDSRNLPLQHLGALHKPPKHFYLVSGIEAAKLGKRSVTLWTFDERGDQNTHDDWAVAVFPMKSLEPKTQTIIPAYQCKGCAREQHGFDSVWRPSATTSCQNDCQISLPDGVDVPMESADAWQQVTPRRTCRVVVARGRQYTEEEMLAHFADCGPAHAMMADLAEELQRQPRR